MGGGSIMFWGAVGWKGKSNIILCPNKLDQKSYKDILRDEIIGKGKDLAGHGWIFQHDNASVHKANSITKYFSANKRRVLDWPAISPDLNIIENIWGILSRKVYADGTQYSNLNELQISIEKCWKEIEISEVQKLFKSLPNRIFKTIYNHGGPSGY